MASGQVEFFAEQKQEGDLEDVYEGLCQRSARQLADQVRLAALPASSRDAEMARLALEEGRPQGLSFKRRLALGLWGTSVLGVVGGTYFQMQVSSAKDDYDDAWDARDYEAASTAYSDYDDARFGRNTSLSVSVGTALVGAVLWFWPE